MASTEAAWKIRLTCSTKWADGRGESRAHAAQDSHSDSPRRPSACFPGGALDGNRHTACPEDDAGDTGNLRVDVYGKSPWPR